MDGGSMISLAYFSSAARGVDVADLGLILQQSQRNNARAGVTGLLCHYDGSFLQFLEGEPEAVDTVLERISADPRHQQILIVHRQPITARAFADWSMGLVEMAGLSEADQAFCTALRDLQIASSAPHRDAIEPLLLSFKSWLR
jgi:hypothetical protein